MTIVKPRPLVGLAVALGVIALGLGACATREAGVALEPTAIAIQRKGPPDSADRPGEAARLRGVTGAWRQGGRLTVDTDEGIQFRFVDAGTCEGFYTCRRWTFQGSVQILHASPVAQGKELKSDFWLVEFEQGEGGYWMAVNKESGATLEMDTQPAVSRDGRRWAAGECNFESDSGLTIYEGGAFGGVAPVAVSLDDAPCCDIVGWDGEALKVKLCDLEPGKAYPDRLVRQADGSWRGQHVRLEKAKAP